MVRRRRSSPARYLPAALTALLIAACGAADAEGPAAYDPRALPPSDELLAGIGGNADSGRRLLDAYGCGSCHSIPGVRGSHGRAGPPLDRWAYRLHIAGAVPNTPEALRDWIVDPQAIEPGSAMPDVGVTDAHARHMVAYLFGLR